MPPAGGRGKGAAQKGKGGTKGEKGKGGASGGRPIAEETQRRAREAEQQARPQQQDGGGGEEEVRSCCGIAGCSEMADLKQKTELALHYRTVHSVAEITDDVLRGKGLTRCNSCGFPYPRVAMHERHCRGANGVRPMEVARAVGKDLMTEMAKFFTHKVTLLSPQLIEVGAKTVRKLGGAESAVGAIYEKVSKWVEKEPTNLAAWAALFGLPRLILTKSAGKPKGYNESPSIKEKVRRLIDTCDVQKMWEEAIPKVKKKKPGEERIDLLQHSIKDDVLVVKELINDFQVGKAVARCTPSPLVPLNDVTRETVRSKFKLTGENEKALWPDFAKEFGPTDEEINNAFKVSGTQRVAAIEMGAKLIDMLPDKKMASATGGRAEHLKAAKKFGGETLCLIVSIISTDNIPLEVRKQNKVAEGVTLCKPNDDPTDASPPKWQVNGVRPVLGQEPLSKAGTKAKVAAWTKAIAPRLLAAGAVGTGISSGGAAGAKAAQATYEYYPDAHGNAKDISNAFPELEHEAIFRTARTVEAQMPGYLRHLAANYTFGHVAVFTNDKGERELLHSDDGTGMGTTEGSLIFDVTYAVQVLEVLKVEFAYPKMLLIAGNHDDVIYFAKNDYFAAISNRYDELVKERCGNRPNQKKDVIIINSKSENDPVASVRNVVGDLTDWDTKPRKIVKAWGYNGVAVGERSARIESAKAKGLQYKASLEKIIALINGGLNRQHALITIALAVKPASKMGHIGRDVEPSVSAHAAIETDATFMRLLATILRIDVNQLIAAEQTNQTLTRATLKTKHGGLNCKMMSTAPEADSLAGVLDTVEIAAALAPHLADILLAPHRWTEPHATQTEFETREGEASARLPGDRVPISFLAEAAASFEYVKPRIELCKDETANETEPAALMATRVWDKLTRGGTSAASLSNLISVAGGSTISKSVKLQKAFNYAVSNDTYLALTLGPMYNDWVKAGVRASAQTGAGAWLNMYGVTKQTELEDIDVLVALWNRLGVPFHGVIDANTRCGPRCPTLRRDSYEEEIDMMRLIFGVHACYCGAGSARLKRHNAVLDAWGQVLRECGYVWLRKEVSTSLRSGRRGDGLATRLSRNPRKEIHDVTITHPLGKSVLRQQAAFEDAATAAAEKDKIGRHAAGCFAISVDFKPIAMSVMGGLGKIMRAYIDEAFQEKLATAKANGESEWEIVAWRTNLITRLNVALIRGNGEMVATLATHNSPQGIEQAREARRQAGGPKAQSRPFSIDPSLQDWSDVDSDDGETEEADGGGGGGE